MPEIGKNYDIILKGLKGYHYGQHIIFYFQKEYSIIEIIRILHKRMDLKNRLQGK
jgi:toxin ParE1/3/4